MQKSHLKAYDFILLLGCEKCPAIEKCEIVVCSFENRLGKIIPITSESCELSCEQGDISCRRFPSGRLDWYPFNPCTVTTTTSSTTSTFAPITTVSASVQVEDVPPSFDYQSSFETADQIPSFFPPGSTTGEMLHDIEPSHSHVEPTAQRKKHSYGLSWLVSEPELELILWVMFGVALLLMLIGFVGLGGFVCYRRRIKKQIKITTCPRYYDSSRQRAYGIVAYDTSTYNPGLEYEKLRGSNGACLWAQRSDTREPGTIRRIPSPQISMCSPYCSSNRRITAEMDRNNYIHQVPIPSTSYRLTECTTPLSSGYHLVTFGSSVDPIDGAVACKPSACIQDVSYIHGVNSGTTSLDRQRRTVLTMSPDRQITGGTSSLGTGSPLPLRNDNFALGAYHRTNSYQSEMSRDAEATGQIIQQQTKV